MEERGGDLFPAASPYTKEPGALSKPETRRRVWVLCLVGFMVRYAVMHRPTNF